MQKLKQIYKNRIRGVRVQMKEKKNTKKREKKKGHQKEKKKKGNL
jgi:hypothetical protein